MYDSFESVMNDYRGADFQETIKAEFRTMEFCFQRMPDWKHLVQEYYWDLFNLTSDLLFGRATFNPPTLVSLAALASKMHGGAAAVYMVGQSRITGMTSDDAHYLLIIMSSAERVLLLIHQQAQSLENRLICS